MHAIRWVGLGLMLSLPLLSIAAPGNIVKSEKDLYEECGAYSQAGMKDCLVRKVDESRVSLKKAEMDVIAVIKNGTRIINISVHPKQRWRHRIRNL
ncbi:hypothetical protein [Burkholderia ubonensis]|uniref:hypothetical protein n=1 Tax=Burkholderia ubonensis TaxID=101571 RepID=UPI000AD4D01A|nr:hypothetical protein [Burkholderia ubonensis]